MEFAKTCWRDKDRAGFDQFASRLYSGDGTNYVPAIALHGWHSREFLGDFKASREAYLRLQRRGQADGAIAIAFREGLSLQAKTELRKLSLRNDQPLQFIAELKKICFQFDLEEQMRLVERDIAKENSWVARIIYIKGYGAHIKNDTKRFTDSRYEELRQFLLCAPPVFVNALSVEPAARMPPARAW